MTENFSIVGNEEIANVNPLIIELDLSNNEH